MRYAFAGDRKISVNILKFIISKGYRPLALFVSSDSKQSHADELIKISGLNSSQIFKGKSINDISINKKLNALNLDYIFGIHFPYIISKKTLDIPNIGFLNLHPAYLPYNKGWNTPSWAILDNTPYGATLHFMSEELDKGDIICQEKISIESSDTANSLYQTVLDKEFDVFIKSFEMILSLNPKRIKQKAIGTSHNKKDLKTIQKIDLKKQYKGKALINLIRALTTNDITESAYFIENGIKNHIQISIIKRK